MTNLSETKVEATRPSFPMGWLRNLYDWVLGWADTPYGTVALVVLAFTESSFFPIPPDVLLIALCLGDRRKWYRFVAWCSAASVVGGMFGYALGLGAWSAIDQVFFTYVPGFSEETFEHVTFLYDKWNFWIVFIAAFTPIPYKVITITAGVCKINFFIFVVATIIGRTARFALVGFLLYWFGESIRRFIDKWFNVLTILFVFLLLGGFFLLKVLH